MRSMWLLLPLLAACDPNDGTVVSNGELLPIEAAAVAVYGPTPANPLRLLVRAVDARLLSAGPGVVTATIDGAPVEVEVDARGYGEHRLAGPGAVALGGVGQERAVGVGSPMVSAWGPAIGGLGAASAVEEARRGALAVVGETVWWVGPGLPAHPVARFEPGDTPTVRALPVDDDGAIDAVAWAGERVVLLRGRDEGGASGGLNLRAPGWQARGADVRDIDDDGRRDLAIAWATPGGGVIQVWKGDGLWGFEPLYERTIASPPLDLAVARDRGDGAAIATTITEDGGWQRLARTEIGEWRLTGPPLTIGGVDGSTIRSGGDYSGSGADDLVTAGPREPGVDREALIWQLDGDPPTFVRTMWRGGGHLAYADLERSGLRNLVGIEEATGALRYLTWRDGQAANRDLGAFTGVGPIGFGEYDDDAIPDLLVADSVWTWFHGVDDREDASRWRPRRALGIPHGLALWGPVAASADGLVVGVTRNGDLLRLSRIRFDGVAPLPDGHVNLGAVDEAVIDLVVCGDQAYVLTVGELIAVRVGQGVVGRRPMAAPVSVACGAGPGGAVVGVVDGDEIVLADAAAAVVSRLPAEGARHLALYDAGDGPAAVRCAGRCAAWPTPDGPALAVAGADALVVSGPHGASTFVGGGALPVVQDLDGDGAPELLWRFEQRFVGVLRAVAGAVAEPMFLHVEPALEGAPVVASLGGGPRDLFLRRDQSLHGAP